jgi:hypothetical protein
MALYLENCVTKFMKEVDGYRAFSKDPEPWQCATNGLHVIRFRILTVSARERGSEALPSRFNGKMKHRLKKSW